MIEDEIRDFTTFTRRIPGDPIMVIGSSLPMGWIDRETGEMRRNLDYIAPALPPEPAQYEQALVGYELCEKVSNV